MFSRARVTIASDLHHILDFSLNGGRSLAAGGCSLECFKLCLERKGSCQFFVVVVVVVAVLTIIVSIIVIYIKAIIIIISIIVVIIAYDR